MSAHEVEIYIRCHFRANNIYKIKTTTTESIQLLRNSQAQKHEQGIQ
jgi:hypothetical protein